MVKDEIDNIIKYFTNEREAKKTNDKKRKSKFVYVMEGNSMVLKRKAEEGKMKKWFNDRIVVACEDMFDIIER
jgi:hypothetical protein